jgi:hypothetical protein
MDNGKDGGLNQEAMEKEMQEDQHLGQQWAMAKKKKRAVCKKSQVQNTHPTRQSARLAKDGVLVMEKATRRVEVLKNCSGYSFGILSTVDSKYLHSLAVDSNISMGGQEEVLIQHLDSFKAQELA